MAKLLEKNGREMMAALVGIAGPLKRLMEDQEFETAFKQATIKGIRMGWTDVLRIYVDVVPFLFGDEHVKDTIGILAIIEGKSVIELLEMDGTELIADALRAFKEQIQPFFMRLGVSVGAQQSSQ